MTLSREVEWDDEQQALMLALRMYQAQLCPAGHYLPEAGAAAGEGQYNARVRRCHACTTTAQKADAMRDSPHPGALLYGVERR